MRLIHRGLILVAVPLLLSAATIGSMLVSITHLDRQRLEAARQRIFTEKCADLFLSMDGVGLDVVDATENGHHTKDELKQDVKRMLDQAADVRSDPLYVRDLFAEKAINTVALYRQALLTVAAKGSVTTKLQAISDLSAGTINSRIYDLAVTTHAANVEQITVLQRALESDRAALYNQTNILLGAAIASVLLAWLLARWLISPITSRLAIVTQNTVNMAERRALQPPLGGNDEVATLDRSFHAMNRTLQEAMERERSLFESVSDMICIVDADCVFTAVNPAGEKMLGLGCEVLMGKQFLDFVVCDDVETTQKHIQQARSNAVPGTFENRCQCADGKVVDLLWSIYWSQIDGALYMVAHDITERKQIERLKQEFLAMVSHDLRSPLTAMVITLKLITAGVLGQVSQSFNDKIQGMRLSINRLLTLINDLLDMEKLEAGKLKLDRQPVEIGSLLNSAIAELAPLAEQKKLRLETNCTNDDIAWIDRERMLQVIVNLVSNAIKFSPEGGLVSLNGARAANDFVIEITDQGCGIPKPQQALIFERFKQAETSDSKPIKGTGLGLPICKSIIEEHGGQIAVVSEPGHPTTFRFSIPVDGEADRNAQTSLDNGGELQAQDCLKPARNRTLIGRRLLRGFSNLRLIQKGAILVLLPVAFEILFGLCLYPLLCRTLEAKQFENHQRQVALCARDVLCSLGALGCAKNFEASEAKRFSAFRAAADETFAAVGRLSTLTAGDPHESSVTRKISELLNRLAPAIQRSHLSTFADRQPEAVLLVDSNEFIFVYKQGRPLIEQLVEGADRRSMDSPLRLAALHKFQAAVLAGGFAGSVLLCLLSAVLFADGVAKRIQVMEDNVRRFERGEALNGELEGKDEVAHLDHVFQDMVAALNEARHKERAVFDNCQDVMCILEKNGTILTINPACQEQWQYTSSDLRGHSILEYIAPEFSAGTAEQISAVVRGSPSADLETGIIRKDGSSRIVLMSLALSAKDETVAAIMRDISERKELEKLKKEFVAMVSHDMRTPLSSVVATTEALSAGVFGTVTEKIKQRLDIVAKNCTQLIGLISDLLDIEKLEAGEMKLIVERASVKDIFQRTVDALGAVAQEKGIRLEVEVPDQLCVACDPDRLAQVVSNLVSNAIKFSPENTMVALSAHLVAGIVEFRVQDQGRGIPEPDRNALFQPYSQVQLCDGRRGVGTGIGLAICRQIVERHGGAIGVESRLGEGTTFYFRIPNETQPALDVVQAAN